MRRRLVGAIVAITTLAVILFGVPLAVVVRRMVDEQSVLRLERQTMLASRAVPARLDDGDPIELPDSPDIDFALYGTDGVRVTGVGPATADELTMRALGNAVVDGEIAETLVVVVPVLSDEAVTGAIRAQQGTAIIDRRFQRILALLAALAAGVVAVASTLAYLLAAHITRPIRLLRDATVQLGTGDFAIDTPRSRIPELADTATALGATAQRLDDLVTRERAFSADASHQLRTPLTAMRATIETELAYPRPHRRDALREALSDINRLETTITELLNIARNTRELGPIDLAPVLDQLASTWRSRYHSAGRNLVVGSARYEPHPMGHATMLRHALDILVDNALLHGNGTTTIDVAHTEETVTITVSDEGDGFADGGRGAASPGGHGHGLPLARRLLSAMHGRLTITRPGSNPCTELTLRRPRQEFDVPASPAP